MNFNLVEKKKIWQKVGKRFGVILRLLQGYILFQNKHKCACHKLNICCIALTMINKYIKPVGWEMCLSECLNTVNPIKRNRSLWDNPSSFSVCFKQ